MRMAVIGSAGLLALMALSGRASADVVVSPEQAAQGDGANVTLSVTNDSTTAAVTKVELDLPEQYPIAEVYPLSTEAWAPAQTYRDIDEAVQTLHGISQNQVTSSIIWTTMPGQELRPGQTTKLSAAIGPLPTTTDKLVLAVHVTYSDGKVLDRPALAIALQKGTGVAHDHDGAPVDGLDDTAQQPGDSSTGTYLPWVLGVLVLIAVLTAFSLLRQRKADKVPVTAKPAKARDTYKTDLSKVRKASPRKAAEEEPSEDGEEEADTPVLSSASGRSGSP
jgi:hypothetical protein